MAHGSDTELRSVQLPNGRTAVLAQPAQVAVSVRGRELLLVVSTPGLPAQAVRLDNALDVERLVNELLDARHELWGKK